MKKEYKAWLLGAAVLMLFDIVGAIASDKFHFSEDALTLLTFLIYFAIAYEGARLRNYKVAVVFAVLLSLLDGTAGFAIDYWLGPKADQTGLTVGIWFETLLIVTAIAAFLGLMAGGIAALSAPRKE
jgi:hypothetical protein